MAASAALFLTSLDVQQCPGHGTNALVSKGIKLCFERTFISLLLLSADVVLVPDLCFKNFLPC